MLLDAVDGLVRHSVLIAPPLPLAPLPSLCRQVTDVDPNQSRVQHQCRWFRVVPTAHLDNSVMVQCRDSDGDPVLGLQACEVSVSLRGLDGVSDVMGWSVGRVVVMDAGMVEIPLALSPEGYNENIIVDVCVGASRLPVMIAQVCHALVSGVIDNGVCALYLLVLRVVG